MPDHDGQELALRASHGAWNFDTVQSLPYVHYSTWLGTTAWRTKAPNLASTTNATGIPARI